MPKALIQFLQGVTTPGPGLAMIGIAASAVTVTNSTDDPSVKKWTFEVIDAPTGSTVPIGVNQDGGKNSYQFTPDIAGGYEIHMVVQDNQGNFSEDWRVFQIAEASGRIIPPFTADASALNFAGQKKGWAPYLDAYLKAVDAGGGVANPFFLGTYGTNYIGFGANALLLPTLGDLRFPTAASAYLDSGGNVCLFESDGTTANFGTNLAYTSQHTNVDMYASSSVGIGLGAVTYAYMQGGLVQIGKPLVGMPTTSSPYGAVDGEVAIAMAAATHALTAAEYQVGNVRVTGTGTNIIQFPLGGTGTGAYVRYVHNAGTGTLSVRDTAGNAPAATLAAGAGAWFKFYNDGAQKVKQLTASFAVA